MPDLNSFLSGEQLVFPAAEGPLDLIVLATGKDKAATDELLVLVNKVKAVADSDKEPGCHLYRVTLSVNDNTIGIIETYDNKEAFDHHLSSPEFQALGAQIPTLTTGLFAKWTKVAK